MKKALAIAVLSLFCIAPAWCQTAPAPSQPSGYPFTITGNFAASTGNTVSNGIQSTFEYQLSPSQRWQLRVDEITDLKGNLISLGDGQFRIPFGRIIKSAPAPLSAVLMGVHAGLGAVKDTGGAVSFALDAGLTVDYPVSSFFFIRVIEFTDVYSRGLGGQQLFGNYNHGSVASGIGWNF